VRWGFCEKRKRLSGETDEKKNVASTFPASYIFIFSAETVFSVEFEKDRDMERKPVKRSILEQKTP